MLIKHCVIPFVLGILLSYSYCPAYAIFALPLALLAIYSLVMLLRDKNLKLTLYCFGLGFIGHNLFWIFNAFDMREPELAILKYPCFFVSSGILSALFIVPGMMLRYFSSKKVVPISIYIITTLIGILFPYIVFGNILISHSYLSQAYALFGANIIGLIILLLLYHPQCLVMILIVLQLYGVFRIDQYKDYKYYEQFVSLISTTLPNHMGDQSAQSFWLNTLIEMSLQAEENDLIIWPEASFPYFIEENNQEVLHDIGLLLKDRFVIFGADYVKYNEFYNLQVYNSLLVMHNSRIEAIYHKVKLVPFGEYIPFQSFFSLFLDKIAYGQLQDFTAGNNNNVINIKNLKILPFICYESAFADYVQSVNIHEADLLINIANDQWFGNSIGLKRNLISNQIRAIENGRVIIRVANSGISTIITPIGHFTFPIFINASSDGKIMRYQLPKQRLQTVYSMLSW